MANVGYDSGGRSSESCCRCCPSDCPAACGNLVSCLCGCTLAWRDITRLLPCVVWVVCGVLTSVLHIVIALCRDRFPETMPIFWGWLSALPAFMSAVLIMMYHREALSEKGLTKDAAINLGLLYGFLTTLGTFIYITFVIASVVFIFRCSPDLPHVRSTLDQCKVGSLGFNVFCFFMTLGWLVIQSYLTPRPRFVQELILKHEHAQAGVSLAAVRRHRAASHHSHSRGRLAAAGGESGNDVGGGAAAAAVGAAPVAATAASNLHPTLYGNPIMYETAMVYTGQSANFTGPSTYTRTTVEEVGEEAGGTHK